VPSTFNDALPRKVLTMKRFLSTLIPIAVFAGLVLVILISMLGAENWLGLNKPWPMFIGLGCAAVVLAALYFWTIRVQKKEASVLRRSKHSVFGDVRHLVDHWESSVAGVGENDGIEIWGETTSPTDQQVSTMLSVREQLPALIDLAVVAGNDYFNDYFKDKKLVLSRENIKLESVYLVAKPIGSFDLCFEAPGQLPWGFNVTFADFKVDEVSDNH
jgi:hypothetical protein